MKPTKRWTERRALYITNELKKKCKCSCSIDVEAWSYYGCSTPTPIAYIVYIAKNYNPHRKCKTWAGVEALFAEFMTEKGKSPS